MSEKATTDDIHCAGCLVKERCIAKLEAEKVELKRENERLLSGIRSARHCLTCGRNTTPTEGEQFDIGTTYTILGRLLLTAEEPE